MEGASAGGALWVDWIAAALSACFVGGLYIDGWAHHHNKIDQSFFTPWHAVLYGGFGATAMFLVLMRLQDRGRAVRALSAGYGLSLVGSAIFLIGGVADMVWHIVFGIEIGVDALYSPSHLTLALGMTLMVTGPLRAAWRRPETAPSLLRAVPMLLSLTFLLSVLTFFTQVSHPLVRPRPAGYGPGAEPLIFLTQALGVSGILLQTALLMGLVFLAMRRWTLPRGSLTLVFALNAAGMSVFNDQYRLIAPLAIAGVCADALLYSLRPSVARPWTLRVFGFAVPVLLYALYFATLILTTGIWWSVHLWTGSVVLAGIAGLLLSYVVLPPPSSEAR
jgi:hypothetical protein